MGEANFYYFTCLKSNPKEVEKQKLIICVCDNLHEL